MAATQKQTRNAEIRRQEAQERSRRARGEQTDDGTVRTVLAAGYLAASTSDSGSSSGGSDCGGGGA